MPYYEFFVYSPTRSGLKEAEETLVQVYEFDPYSSAIQPSWKPSMGRVGRFLRRLVGFRRSDDWLMRITGPEIYRQNVHIIAEAWGGFCDGGGYGMYDPTEYYTDEQIRRHTEAWEKSLQEAQERYLASLPEEERASVQQAMDDLARHMTEHEGDEE
jgi:hypothetical protein